MKSKAQEMKYNAKMEMRETLNPGYERKSDTSSDEDSKEEAGDDYDQLVYRVRVVHTATGNW